MNSNAPKAFTLGLSLLYSFNTGAAADTNTLEEIVVTAQKRVESEQKIPVALQAVSHAQLEAGNVQNLMDLPQLSSSLTTQDNAYFLPYIRGIGSTDSGTGIYSSVAIYVDGVYTPRLTGTLEDIDAEQIQILKGPQGSLYGRNATGGAIVVTTKSANPGDPLKAQIEVGAGDYNRKDVKAFVSGGITDDLAGTFSASLHKRDGWTRNLGGVTSQDGWGDNSYSFEGKLVFKPTDRLSFRLSASYNNQDTSNVLYTQLAKNSIYQPFAAFGNNTSLNGGQSLAAGLLFAFTFPALGPNPTFPATQGLVNNIVALTRGIQFSNVFGASYDNQISGWSTGLLPGGKPNGSFLESKTSVFSLNSRYMFDGFDLVSLTSYGQHDLWGGTEVLNANPGTADFSALGFPGINIGLSADDFSHSFSEDLSLVSSGSKIDWIAGLYFFNEHGLAINSLDVFGLSTLSGDADWSVDSVAGYGQLTYPLTNHWNATAGTRYTQEKYILDDQLDPQSPYNLLGLSNTGNRSVKSARSTFDAKLDYRADDWLAYGSVSTGFKSGGFNPQSTLSAPVIPETITAYELGWKSEWFDHRLRLNGAIYHYNYEHIQITAYDTSSGSNFSVSAPKAHINGADLDFEVLPAHDITLFGGITWLNTEYIGDAPITIGTNTQYLPISGNHLPFAPDFKTTLGFNYTIPKIETLRLTGTVEYNSGYWLEIGNRVGTGGSGSASSVTTTTLNLKYTSPDSHWYSSVWVNNLFNKEYYEAGIVVSGLGESGVPGQPRNFGVTFGVNF